MTEREANFFFHGLWFGLHLDQDLLKEAPDGWEDVWHRAMDAIHASGVPRGNHSLGEAQDEVRAALERGGFRGEYYKSSHPCTKCECSRWHCAVEATLRPFRQASCSCGHSIAEHDPST